MARESATDWLGQEYGPGDYVTYAVISGGRSAEMCLGQVISLNDSGTVSIRGIRGAKGSHYYGRIRYRDKRTGKGIILGAKHEVKPSCYTNENYPGVEFSHEQAFEKVRNRTGNWADFRWQAPVYHDYVERIDNPDSVVTLNKNAGVRTITKVPDWLAEGTGESGDQAPEG